ncbi:hypothetical protein LMTR13_11355 [Bradyrhizobium icense]|uniref:Uncharacterized protein n=2 Tax=Bradyrhizobium icense TaxID=1274631 RepID=A0A1B1UDC5_9BRAD|nr:hypothetical protein LMTR13_11355 [Bradyrhizobium icense]
MARGGARKGAGRKPGASTRVNQAAREQALASGISPLDYMLTLLRDRDLPRADRFEAAKAAAPYVHARLAAVEHSGSVGIKRATEVSDDELAHIAAGSSEGTAEAPIDPAQLN